MKQVYIFGAHSRARTLGEYLTKLDPGLRVEAYLVDNEEENPESIEDVPVLFLKGKPGGVNLHINLPVYLGIRGVYQEAAVSHLAGLGFRDIRPVTPELDRELRNRYLEQYYSGQGRTFEKLEKLEAKKQVDVACLYVAKSVWDKPLRNHYEKKPYEREIQVGAALTAQRLSQGGLTDDTGENISDQNRQFCELTALYWIWRNAKERVVGLEHYRRRFLLKEDWLRTMEANQVDAILPTPLVVEPSIEENYKSRHVAADWEFLLSSLRRLDPVRGEAAERFFRETKLYSPCNMFLMRKEVLDEFCKWLFPILFLCAEHIGAHEDAYQNRYPGFMAERLLTFYFEFHRDRFRVVYADKDFRM